MNEEWKDIPEYEGYYQFSSLGRIKSLDREITNINGKVSLRKGKVKAQTIDKGGYQRVNLYKNNIFKHCPVHRLVAKAFIPNPENKPEVNHIDGNKLNNCVDNLEWCTKSENQQHAWNIGLKEKARKACSTNGKNNCASNAKKSLSKPILQFDIDNNLIKEWKSIHDAERTLKIANTHISECCRGKAKTAGGYIWKFKK